LSVSLLVSRFGERPMSSKSVYRSNAENCLRMAQTTGSDRDKPFWLNLAQSWLQLAEHSTRSGAEAETSDARVGTDSH
jgi:hypothetical protein